VDTAKSEHPPVGKDTLPRWVCRGPGWVASMGIEGCKSRPVGISLYASQDQIEVRPNSQPIRNQYSLGFCSWRLLSPDKNLRHGLAGSVRREGQRSHADGDGVKAGAVSKEKDIVSRT
jgi:hypothetical protein